jgi:hypothetical protein
MKIMYVTVLSLVALAPAGAAQLTEKQADAQLKAATKQARKDHAASLKLRLAALDVDIDTFLAANEDGVVDASFTDLFDDVVRFQMDLYFDFVAFHGSAVDAAIELLDQFADGGDLDGAYPDEFRFGTGAALDDLRSAMQATQAKTLTKARQLLEQAAGKLAKLGDARITFLLEPATMDGRDGFIQGATTGQTRDPLVLHTVLALGLQSVSGGGLLLAAGNGDVDGDPITVRAVVEGGLQTATPTFPELGSPYWTAVVDAGGAGLADGNAYVVAYQGTYAASQGGSVSIP